MRIKIGSLEIVFGSTATAPAATAPTTPAPASSTEVDKLDPELTQITTLRSLVTGLILTAILFLTIWFGFGHYGHGKFGLLISVLVSIAFFIAGFYQKAATEKKDDGGGKDDKKKGKTVQPEDKWVKRKVEIDEFWIPNLLGSPSQTSVLMTGLHWGIPLLTSIQYTNSTEVTPMDVPKQKEGESVHVTVPAKYNGGQINMRTRLSMPVYVSNPYKAKRIAPIAKLVKVLTDLVEGILRDACLDVDADIMASGRIPVGTTIRIKTPRGWEDFDSSKSVRDALVSVVAKSIVDKAHDLGWYIDKESITFQTLAWGDQRIQDAVSREKAEQLERTAEETAAETLVQVTRQIQAGLTREGEGQVILTHSGDRALDAAHAITKTTPDVVRIEGTGGSTLEKAAALLRGKTSNPDNT